MSTDRVAQLQEDAEKLNNHMQDPHPGLSMWNTFTYQLLKRVARHLDGNTLRKIADENDLEDALRDN